MASREWSFFPALADVSSRPRESESCRLQAPVWMFQPHALPNHRGLRMRFFRELVGSLCVPTKSILLFPPHDSVTLHSTSVRTLPYNACRPLHIRPLYVPRGHSRFAHIDVQFVFVNCSYHRPVFPRSTFFPFPIRSYFSQFKRLLRVFDIDKSYASRHITPMPHICIGLDQHPL